LNSVSEPKRDVAIAYGLLRVTLGLNICIHGVSRLIAGVTSFAHSLVPMFQKTPLPAWSVFAFGLVLPWAEALLGMLVLTGFRTRIGLIGGSVLIIALTFGTTLRQGWDTAGLQLIYAAVYAALLAFHEKDRYSIDSWLLTSKNRD
jgi:thiosulfate dehydrogenase (quinone) large subunit